jgi:hypothetical protein
MKKLAASLVTPTALVLCAILGPVGGCGSRANSPDGGAGGAQSGSGGAATDGGAGSGGGGATGGAGAGGAGAGGAGAGGAGAGGAGAGGAGGNPGCASAVANGSCATDGTVCNDGCTNACVACNSLRCTSGHWAAQESIPAPCFSCGTGDCQTNVEYCQKTEGGAVGNPPSYRCLTVPANCRPTPTCACLASSSAPCQVAGPGEVTVTQQVP